MEGLEAQLGDARRQLRQHTAGPSSFGQLREPYRDGSAGERLVVIGQDLPQVAALLQFRREMLSPEDMIHSS